MKPLPRAHNGSMASLAFKPKPLRWARQTVQSISIVTLMLLSACGQKGPLVRPNGASNASTAPVANKPQP